MCSFYGFFDGVLFVHDWVTVCIYMQTILVSLRKVSMRCVDYGFIQNVFSQLMRLWYLLHRRPAMAQARLRVRAVSPEPSLVTHMKYGSSRRVQPKRHLAPMDGCACVWRMSLRRTKSAIISWDGAIDVTITLLNIQTDRSSQTVLTQIRALIQGKSAQGLLRVCTACYFCLHLLDTLLSGKTLTYQNWG